VPKAASSTPAKPASSQPLHLGIEAGGTKTIVVAADSQLREISKQRRGPANLRLISDPDLDSLLQKIAADFPNPASIGIGMAGLRDAQDRTRVERLIRKIWPNAPAWIGNDLEAALGAVPSADCAQVLILSGTGSCCYGRRPDGATAKLGGWGHILGDKGSGYEIGLRSLKAIVYYYDRDGLWSVLGESILRKLALNAPNDLIAWAQAAAKTDIASLAPEVFWAASRRDKIARDILEGAANTLAKDGVSCARRLAKSGARVEFVLAGSVLTKQPRFAKTVKKLVLEKWPSAAVRVLDQEGAWGALLAGKTQAGKAPGKTPAAELPPSRPASIYVPPPSRQLSPTEQRNPLSSRLDKISIRAAVQLMLSEDHKIVPALEKELSGIAKGVRLVSAALQKGGRLFYVGAGTSGRLGVLDASECPPTFRTDPELVQGIIAGGQRALWQAVEGAEDNAEAGAEAIEFRRVTQDDVVAGIAASGRTPFVWGAFAAAKRAGARTILICFNPGLEIDKKSRPDLMLAPKIGPEVLTGSSRLKAGTATKLILNMFTTLAMVQMGKVMSNLMVDLNPSNVKLRDRAVRIVMEISGCEREQALQALDKSGWVVKKACGLLRKSA
jgi:N-acetylmuramic acid 6-phosphate etherase